jgi:hypothetical protein
MRMRIAWLTVIALAFLQRAAIAQGQPAEEGDAKRGWTSSLSAYTFIVPDDREYIQPTLRADHDWLHLEARYNYEDLNTASIWLGYNWSFGKDVTLDLTPMIGGVFGDTDGVAPGYELTLAWKELQLYSEAEYVFDSDDSSDNFFYTWSELTWAFTDWFRAGGVIQRTKVYDTDFDIQRGFMAGLTYKHLDFTVYVLNPDDDPIWVFGIAYGF